MCGAFHVQYCALQHIHNHVVYYALCSFHYIVKMYRLPRYIIGYLSQLSLSYLDGDQSLSSWKKVLRYRMRKYKREKCQVWGENGSNCVTVTLKAWHCYNNIQKFLCVVTVGIITPSPSFLELSANSLEHCFTSHGVGIATWGSSTQNVRSLIG